MLRFTVRKAALVGAVLAALVGPARADDCCSPAPCAPAAPAFRTVYVNESVPETYQARRVTYRSVPRVENYTAYRCVTVPEVRERVCTTYQRVSEVRTEVRNVCVSVPVCENRTVMKPCWTTQNVTTMKTRCVDRGHYECREVHSRRAAMKARMHKHHHRHDCCAPCPPPCTKTVKVWVPCMVQECYPVTSCKKVCTMVPTVVKVTTCRQEVRPQSFQVTCWKCVPVNQTVRTTVMCSRMVPYQATRTVMSCVPQEEMVTCTRYVTRCVARQVPVDNCSSSYTVCCAPKAKHSRGGRWLRGGRHCCN